MSSDQLPKLLRPGLPHQEGLKLRAKLPNFLPEVASVWIFCYQENKQGRQPVFCVLSLVLLLLIYKGGHLGPLGKPQIIQCSFQRKESMIRFCIFVFRLSLVTTLTALSSFLRLHYSFENKFTQPGNPLKYRNCCVQLVRRTWHLSLYGGAEAEHPRLQD